MMGRKSKCDAVGLLVRGLGLVAWLVPMLAVAAPAGREWGDVEVLQVSGFNELVVPRVEMTATGSPLLIGTGVLYQDSQQDDGLAYKWLGSLWEPWWTLGANPLGLYAVDAPVGRYPLVYTGGSYATDHTFFVSEVIDDHPTPPEIVAQVGQFRTSYGGAFRDPRRWVAIEDRGVLRLFYSDERDRWNEVSTGAIGNYGLNLVALDDTTALMAWAGNGEPLDWGVLRGSRWERSPEILTSGFAGGPRLRFSAGGGAWMTWSSGEQSVFLRRFDGHVWSAPETLFCPAITTPRGAEALSTDLSRDAAYRPLVTWAYTNYLDGSAGVVVNFPNDHGWDPGDQFYSSGYGAVPSIGRDRNGDAWVAWSESFQPFRYTHTHTSATTSVPAVDVSQGHPRLTWTLSTLAPGTWWSVLRRTGAGEFAAVARLQAGASLAMSWTDLDNRSGWSQRDDISYRIRRESVDSRFEWLSPIARFSPGGGRKRHFEARPRGFTTDALTLDLSDAIGSELTVTIYDLAGRVVQQARVQRADRDAQTLKIPLQGGGIRPGVYFARVRDQSGEMSDGAKFVVLR